MGMPDDRHGARRALPAARSLPAQRERQGGDGIVEMLRFRGADDRRGHEGLLGEPGEGDLGRGYAAGRRDGDDLLDNLAVRLLGGR